METMNLKFPDGSINTFEYGKPVVVLGANGSGKTRFSVKIEELNDPSFKNYSQFVQSHIHRLSAQKSLTISDSLQILDYETSKKNLFLGSTTSAFNKNVSRFKSHPATVLLDDYKHVLSLVFAEAQGELQREHENNKKLFDEGKAIPKPAETIVDKVTKIWNALLPNRTIDLLDNNVHVNYNNQKYHGQEMSDGERVILYMICQALVVKPNSLFIIDEPELHIHKAVVNELWTLLENERPDCIFMYLTHDIDFALSRNNAQYLWMKNFDGSNWEYEFLSIDDYPDLPRELLLELLGTRQKIVFVEGTKDSFDYKLYQEIYRDQGYHVIPCGGCQEVIRLVKAKKEYETLQAIDVYGIIDRDFRVDKEIESLEESGIYVIKVAEVENLFVVPELLYIMADLLGCDDSATEEAKKFIVELFEVCKSNQINEALAKEITHQLSIDEIGKDKKTDEEIKSYIDGRYTIENIKKWRAEKEEIFNSATELRQILRVFNKKELSKKIGAKFGLPYKDYPNRVLNYLTKKKEARARILAALYNYVPELP